MPAVALTLRLRQQRADGERREEQRCRHRPERRVDTVQLLGEDSDGHKVGAAVLAQGLTVCNLVLRELLSKVADFVARQRPAEIQLGAGRLDDAVHETANVSAVCLMVFFKQHASSSEGDGQRVAAATRGAAAGPGVVARGAGITWLSSAARLSISCRSFGEPRSRTTTRSMPMCSISRSREMQCSTGPAMPNRWMYSSETAVR